MNVVGKLILEKPDYWTFQKSSRCVPDWLAEIGQHPIQEKSKILAKLAEDTVPSWENRLIACSCLFADRYFPHVPDALTCPDDLS
jgi:hypothetical protein